MISSNCSGWLFVGCVYSSVDKNIWMRVKRSEVRFLLGAPVLLGEVNEAIA